LSIKKTISLSFCFFVISLPLTNDKAWQQFEEIKVVLVEELNTS